MRASFRPLTVETIESALPFMAALYRQGDMDFDAMRTRRVCEWLVANPELGGVWLIEANGAGVGYVAVTVSVSIEFHGRHALLDELYIDGPWRGQGLGPQAVEFAAGWARARGLIALRLEVGDENEHGLHVYRKSGFDLHADRRLMTKWL